VSTYSDEIKNLSGYEVISLLTNNDCEDKYYKLNLCSLNKYGTLEFRQHKGTLEFNEIQHWIKFCIEFLMAGVQKHEGNDSLFRGINSETKEFYRKSF
jgi:hypothetical protein